MFREWEKLFLSFALFVVVLGLGFSAPSVAFVSPTLSNGSDTSNDWIFANVTFDESLTNITYSLYNSTGLVNSTNFSSPISPNSTNFTSLQDNTYFLNVTAYNTTNISNSSETRQIIVDTTSPSVSIVSPLNYTNSTSPSIVFNVTDSGSGLNQSSLVVIFNGSSVSVTNASISTGFQIIYSSSGLVHGQIYITNATISDLAGNSHSLEWNITVDTIAPSEIGNFTILETLVSTNVSSRTLNGTGATLNWTLSSDGTTFLDHYELWARNRSYNTSSSSFNEWSSWYAFNPSIGNTTTNTSLTLTDYYEYELNLSSVDAANNRNSTDSINVTVDGGGPQFASYSNGSLIRIPDVWTNLTNTTISVNITDISGIDNSSVRVSFNGSDVSSFNITPLADNATEYKIDFDVTSLADNANHTMIVNATDLLGNANTSIAYDIRTDFVAPVSGILINQSNVVSGSSGWYLDNATYLFNCTDALAGIESYTVNNTGSIWENDTATSHNLTVNESGNLTYLFSCRDAAGNINSTTLDIAVDASAPSFNVSSENPTNNAEGVETSGLTVSVEFSDTGAGVETGEEDSDTVGGCKITISPSISSSEKGTLDCNSGSMSRTFTLSSSTTYTVTANVTDKVGHSDEFEWIFKTKSGSPSSSSGGGGSGSTSSPNAGSNNTATEKATLIWASIPKSVELSKDNKTSIKVILKNSGDLDISGITISATGDLNVSISPLQITNLDSGKSSSVTLEIVSENTTETGIHNITLEAKSSTTAAKTSFSVKIQPEEYEKAQINDSLQNIGLRITELKGKFDTANSTVENETALTTIIEVLEEIDSLYSSAQDALVSGDFAQAYELQKELDEKIRAAESALDTIVAPDRESSLWIFILIGVIIVAIIGIILYVSLIPDKLGIERFKVRLSEKKKEVEPRDPEKKEDLFEKITSSDPRSKSAIIGELVQEREDFEKELSWDVEKKSVKKVEKSVGFSGLFSGFKRSYKPQKSKEAKVKEIKKKSKAEKPIDQVKKDEFKPQKEEGGGFWKKISFERQKGNSPTTMESPLPSSEEIEASRSVFKTQEPKKISEPPVTNNLQKKVLRSEPRISVQSQELSEKQLRKRELKKNLKSGIRKLFKPEKK